jgi:cardiolipin synthase
VYNLPNILTISRIAVIPLIFISIYINSFMWAMIAGSLFIAASITDYLDGYLARAWNETSAFGRLLDPIADKLLVATALVVIITKTYVVDGEELHYYTWNGTIIAAFVILCREILVSGLREFLREVNVGLPVTKLAKWKTCFQMTALAMMLFCELSRFWVNLGEFLLWVAAVLTFITGYQYYQKSLEYVKAEEAKKVTPVKVTPVKVATAAKSKTASTAKKKTVSKKAPSKKTATVKKTTARKTSAKAASAK